MRLNQYVWSGLASLLVIGGVATNAQAAIHTLDGDGFTVTFDDAALGLFGTPTLTLDGKTILFSPLNFIAQAFGAGPQQVIQHDSVTLDIAPDAGSRVGGVSLREDGDYRLVYRSGSALSPGVAVFGQFRLTNLFNGTDFVVQNLDVDATKPLDILCPTLNCPASPWAASANLLAPQAWGDAPVRTLLEDNLVAEAFGIGDSAFIEKKAATQTIAITPQIVSTVPVPAALPLLLSGLLGIFGFARRRARS